jgi:general secretion pathway protein G
MNRSHQKAFTIIEIMVVVIIIGILAVLVVPNIIGRVDDARVNKAKTDIASLQTSLDMYRIDNGIYPSNEQGLDALVNKPQSTPTPMNWHGPYIKSLPKDPWGSPYQYSNPGKQGGVDIFSFGPKGQDGDNKEEYIGSWDLN